MGLQGAFANAFIETPFSCEDGAEVLCGETSLYNELDTMDPYVALVFQLYPGPPKVFAGRPTLQYDCELNLKKFVEMLDVGQVVTSLATGANPHVAFGCDDELRDLYVFGNSENLDAHVTF